MGSLVRAKGIEPSSPDWKTGVLAAGRRPHALPVRSRERVRRDFEIDGGESPPFPGGPSPSLMSCVPTRLSTAPITASAPRPAPGRSRWRRDDARKNKKPRVRSPGRGVVVSSSSTSSLHVPAPGGSVGPIEVKRLRTFDAQADLEPQARPRPCGLLPVGHWPRYRSGRAHGKRVSLVDVNSNTHVPRKVRGPHEKIQKVI